MDALLPLACLPAQICARNRVWRRIIIDAIRHDPEWRGGEYPAAAARPAYRGAGAVPDGRQSAAALQQMPTLARPTR
jgi:homoserine O-acetyltransferase